MPNTTFLPIKTALAVGTRLDTWPIPVADGWAGAEMRVFTLFNLIITDGWTNGQMDKASYRVACPQLLIKADKS